MPCPRCDGRALDQPYAALLGFYLGDGYLSRQRRGVFGLLVRRDPAGRRRRLSSCMRAVRPGQRPHTRRPGLRRHHGSWKHWPCLFPQHGPGRKHERPIVLDDWQRAVVEDHPGAFLRGLFHSDGSRVRNWATRPVAGEPKRYDYPRWQFTNESADIRELCCWALDLVDVAWRQSSRTHVSVSRREAVARLDALIGMKDEAQVLRR